MTDLNEVDMVPLNAGLDLRSNRLLGQPGSLSDCLNREIVDSIGLKRIDGFEPYDGKCSPALKDFFYIQNTSYGVNLSADFPDNALLAVSGDTQPFGKVVDTTSADGVYRILYARINRDLEPASGENVVVLGEANNFVATGGVFAGSTLADAPTTVASMNSYSAVLRSDIGALPETPIGLHWFRDRLYAVATDRALHFTSGGTVEPQVNYFIRGATSGTIAKILYISDITGSWGLGTAAGLMQYQLVSGTGFTGTEVLEYSNDVAFGSTLSSNVANYASSGSIDTEYSSLWQSRNERQAIEESATSGWSWIEHGWEFGYESGSSDIGRFTKIEKSSDNNFTFDSGDEYSEPVSIYNGSNVVGASLSPGTYPIVTTEARVDQGGSGWKTNASSTAWADSAALITAVDAADSNYAYANIWYGGTASGPFGYSPGYLFARDNAIIGPTGGAPGTVDAETFDTDFLSGQARSPLILKDLAQATANIPEGSLIVGAEVIVSYTSQNYAIGAFEGDRNGTAGANIVANTVDWIDDVLAWEAGFVTVDSATQSTLMGSVQTAPIVIANAAGHDVEITAGATDIFEMAGSSGSQTATIGSATNTFGISNFSRAELLDPNFGLALYGQVTASPLYPLPSGLITYSGGGVEYVEGTVRLKVDRIRVRFYYTTPSARYYARTSDGQVASVDLVYYVNDEGSLTAGTGEGSWQVANVVAAAGTKRAVLTGDTIHVSLTDATTGGANAIATTTSDMVYNGLPSIVQLNEANSRFQVVSANFYAREDWDGFYGASGAGRAFSFANFDADGSGSKDPYFISINTTSPEERDEDTPRHVAYHHGSLILGYRSGQVKCSVSGQPENFSGVDGAAELGVGDKLTGLLSLAGDTLAVYCEGSIHSFVGPDPLSFQPRTISPRTGAIEYTIINMGIPVHCDSRGVTTLEQSDKYGDFLGERLSANITPWVAQRMLTSDTLFSTFNGNGLVCAIPCRTNNQAWFVFKDGYVLCMTINPGAPPAFTYRRYFLGQTGDTADDLLSTTQAAKFIVPIASSSEIDQYGAERIHVSHFSTLSTATSDFVYELNRGWGFAGNYIPEFYTVNYHYRDPFAHRTVKHVAIDGLTLGVGSSLLNVAEDYATDSAGNTLFNTTSVDVSVPLTPFSRLRQDYLAASRINATGSRGRSVSFKVKGAYYTGTGVTNPLPPDIHQVLLLQYLPGGAPYV